MIISKIIKHVKDVSSGQDTTTDIRLTNFSGVNREVFENLRRILGVDLQDAIYGTNNGRYRSFYCENYDAHHHIGYEFQYNGVDLGIIQTNRWNCQCIHSGTKDALKKNFLKGITPNTTLVIPSCDKISIRRLRHAKYSRENYMCCFDSNLESYTMNAIASHEKEIIDLANKLVATVPGLDKIDKINYDDYNFSMNVVVGDAVDRIGRGTPKTRFAYYTALVIAAFCYMSCSPEEREDVSLLDFPILLLYSENNSNDLDILKCFQKIMPLSQVIYVVQEQP
jgi:hypothetical protein